MSKVKVKQQRQILELHPFVTYVTDFIAKLGNRFRTLGEKSSIFGITHNITVMTLVKHLSLTHNVNIS